MEIPYMPWFSDRAGSPDGSRIASFNELRHVPDSLGELRSLTRLDLDGNELTELPSTLANLEQLIQVDIAGNEICRLPDWLTQLPLLTQLSIADNPLVSPPPEIAAGGSDSALEFVRARMGGSTAQWMSKLLVVGEGGVGKTSLVKALCHDTHDPHERSTHGLRITGVRLEHPDQSVTMSLSTWDFGGQEIYHATHQFFLTDRSLFLLLWNSRLGWEQGRLHYWLDIIKTRAPQSPVFLVATHIHDRPVDLPLTELREQYPQIVASVHVDNAARQGIDELRNALAEQAAALPLMGSEWPTTWFLAAQALRDTPEDHIAPSRMWRVMAAAGVTYDRHQRYLAQAMHELGDILYDAEDPELNQTVVLHPAWVTEYISRVLDSEEVEQRHGLLSRTHLNELWSDLDTGIRTHFLGMMEKYDLSYRVDSASPDDLSLIVERLQWDIPPYQDRWDEIGARPDTREVRVIYQLNTMPPGIPTWFIARSHRFSQKTHWRTGALFGHGDGRHLALIRADGQRNTVELAVRGPVPASFFSVLNEGFDLTLDRFPGLEIIRKVPCRCTPSCTELFKFDTLQERLSRTPQHDSIECHESGERVSIPELLYGISPSDRDPVKAIAEHLDRVIAQLTDRLVDIGFVQRTVLRELRRIQAQQEVRCPSVFVLVPADRRRRLTGTAYEIRLYCEEPGAWHRLPEPHGIYPVTEPAEWFRKLGPWLGPLITVLKHAVPLAGPVLGIAVDHLDGQHKADCDLMKELANQLPAEAKHKRELPAELRDRDQPRGATPNPESRATTDADFRAIKAMLAKLDPDEAWGGLSRFTTPEGLVLYLCQDHLDQYRQPTPA
jgi:GTPase SAR1 family protein